MDRTIKLSDLEAAVARAYENNKSLKEGNPDNRVKNENAGKFAVAVGLTDGSLIVKGDGDSKFALGSLAKIPVALTLLQQLGVDELMKKSGMCGCHKKGEKPAIPVSAKGVRAVSAVQPHNDPEGKWSVISDMMDALMGSSAELDDAAYKEQLRLNSEANAENVLASDGFYLYDDAHISLDIYSKLQSMRVDVKQLATMGATIAADGYNALTKLPAFDGKLSQHLIGMLAAKGLKKMNKGWLIKVGVPAKSGFGGGVLAIVPGVMAVAAFAPDLNEAGVSAKASRAVADVLTDLDISAFASARVRIEK